MDKIAQSANSSRSKRGNSFEDDIIKILKGMCKRDKIRRFERKPKIFGGEFNPDFIIEKVDGTFICIDTTTTARSDRLRGKQWDAYGTKLFYNEERNSKIVAFVVVQDIDTKKNEEDNFRRCKERAKLPHSALDDVISVKELIDYLEH